MIKFILASKALPGNEFLFFDLYDLFDKYNKYLLDDYTVIDSGDLMKSLIAEITSNYRHFYLIINIKKNELIGFVYLNNWVGVSNNYHSCTINTCFKKEYWGKKPLLLGKYFIKQIFDDYNLIKIKAEIFENNFRVKRLLMSLGFEKEALLKDETLVNGKKQSIEIYSVFNGKHYE